MWQMIIDWFRELPSRFWAWLGEMWERVKDRLFDVTRETWKNVAMVVGFLMAIYYPIGMIVVNKIDVTLDLSGFPQYQQEQGSETVSTMAALIDREVNENGWVMNDPFFKPGSMLDNMPNFQQGMFAAFARVTIELRDQVGRMRGSSATDTDLEEAAGLLPYPGDVWIFNFSTSWLPTASAERQYLSALTALNRYNRRLAAGDAVFERRSDNLMATLDRIALDVGASSAAIDQHISEHSSDWVDFGSDDLFYSIKGQTYAYLMVLRALREDFSNVLTQNDLQAAYGQMLDSFEALAMLDPMVVANNELDDQFLPNHLAAQGFYLLRARTQLREITNILLK